MTMEYTDLERRLLLLERANRRWRWMFLASALAGLAAIASALHANGGAGAAPAGGTSDEIRTRRLVVVDDQDRIRVTIDQDSPDIDRYERSAGLTIFDDQGRERGGIATIDDGSAVVALDAPWGVGSPMRDRAGMKVFADGNAAMGVISNRGAFAAVLRSDGQAGHLDLYSPNDRDAVFSQRTLSTAGESTATIPMSDSQREAD